MGIVTVVVGGGPVAPAADLGTAAPAGPVIAADSGLDAALAAGLVPTVLVGDLDSISAAGVAWARDHGVEVRAVPADKDDTDTALALRAALGTGCERLVVLGAVGAARLDHLLGTVVALGSPELAAFESIHARFLGVDGVTHVHVLHPGRSTAIAAPATVFTLLALHGRCTGVDVSGARWPLAGATLEPASTLGVSNERVAAAADVAVGTGVLTVVVPPPPPSPDASEVHP